MPTLQLQRAEISTTSTIHSPTFVSRLNMALPTSRTASNVSWDFEATYEVAEYLKTSETLSEAEVLETMSGMEAYQQATEDARIQQRENQQQYKQEQAAAMEGMSQNRVQKFRQEKALDLREEMLTALFASHGRPFEDTTAESQRMGLGTININVMMTPRSGVSVDDDEVDGVGDEIGDVDDNEVDGVGDKVGGVNMSVQCVDLMLEVIPRLQWTTAFGSIYIQTANLLWAPTDVR
ncbi:hypothetical protein NDA17_003714 [Ustilago hordei]|nr:hypothetical protein NDA17_003714 [Ustilago hordei]